jgi:hypothetical protein
MTPSIAQRDDRRPSVFSATPSVSVGTPTGGGVALRCLRREAFVVRGPRTGWRYEFSESAPVQAVAMQDAELLVATGMFKLEPRAR